MKKILVACVIAVCGVPSLAFADILGSEFLSIDFTKADEAKKKATWSPPAKIAINAKGLGWDGPSNAIRDGWIETKPMAVGLSWRPAQSVNVTLVLTPDPGPVKLPNGTESTPNNPGAAFVRHSPDGKHWSSWQALKSSNEKGQPVRSFSGMVSLPARDRAEYERLMLEYYKLDVPWVDDEEAMAGWIVKRHPDFFRDHRPFVGYVQFLYEDSFWGGQRLTRLEARAAFALNGTHHEPKVKGADKGRDVPWRFQAP